MKNRRLHPATTFARSLVAVFFLLVVLESTTAAQGAPPSVGPPPVMDPKAETHDRQYSEARLRGSETGAEASKMKEQRMAIAVEQTKQDFKRIQVIRNDIVDHLLAKKPLDFKKIAEQSGEINKRANRLKTFLIPAAPAGKEGEQKIQVELKSEEMEDALVRLCNLIYGFSQNPVIKNPGTIDVRQSTKAGGDLLSIIEISNRLQKSAAKLKSAK